MSETNLKRVSLLLREDQHQALLKRGDNYSALVRQLIEEDLGPSTLKIKLSPQGQKNLSKLSSLIEINNQELEAAFFEALKKVVKNKIEALRKVEKDL